MLEKLTLPNGLRILMEPMETVRTACFGVWVASGSKDETRENNGISHFIEHMAFKGTQNRTARQLAEDMDAIGGQMNAFTTKEYTCFYAHTLDSHVEEGFSILAEMITAPRFAEADIETEKGVVQEEIGMSEDDPEDLVFEQLSSAVWKESPYGMPILGSRKTVGGLSGGTLRDYLRRRYAPNRMVVSICGRFDRERFLCCVESFFAGAAAGDPVQKALPLSYRTSLVLTEKPQEQAYLSLCFPGLPSGHPERYAMALLNSVLGGSSSSRLFQRIREELGIAYSIYSDTCPTQAGGLLCIQASVNPSAARRATEEILQVLERARGGVTEREFCRAREHYKSAVLMSMESPASRAGYSGRCELLSGKVDSDDEILAQVEAVTLGQVNRLAGLVLNPARMSLSAVGVIQEKDFFRQIVPSHDLCYNGLE